MRVMIQILLLCLALGLTACTGKVATVNTAAGPQDVGGYEQYILKTPMSQLDRSGFAASGAAKGYDLQKNVTVTLGSGSWPAVLTLGSFGGQVLNNISLRISPQNPADAARLYKQLCRAVRQDYDPAWFKQRVSWEVSRDSWDLDKNGSNKDVLWRTMMLSDNERDGVTITATPDSVSLLVSAEH